MSYIKWLGRFTLGLFVIAFMENAALAQDNLRSDELFSLLPRADDQERDRVRDSVSGDGQLRTTARSGLVAFDHRGRSDGAAGNLISRIANGKFPARKVIAIDIGSVVFRPGTVGGEEQFKLGVELGTSCDKPRYIGHHVVGSALSMPVAVRKLR